MKPVNANPTGHWRQMIEGQPQKLGHQMPIQTPLQEILSLRSRAERECKEVPAFQGLWRGLQLLLTCVPWLKACLSGYSEDEWIGSFHKKTCQAPVCCLLPCSVGGSGLRTLSVSQSCENYKSHWPPQPGVLEVSPGWQPQKIGLQIRVQDLFQETQASSPEAEGEHKGGMHRPCPWRIVCEPLTDTLKISKEASFIKSLGGFQWTSSSLGPGVSESVCLSP